MLSKKKIKIMFLMASYEKGIGKKDLDRVKFYKNDYIRLNILRTVVYVSIAYLLILGLIVMYNIEYVVKNALSIPYTTIGIYAVTGYALLTILYVFITLIVCSVRYDCSRKRVRKYFKYLKYLGKYYQDDENDEEEH